jgi:hypothetical protein
MPTRIVVNARDFLTYPHDQRELAAQKTFVRTATDEDVERAKAGSGWGDLNWFGPKGAELMCLEQDGTLVTEGRTVDLPPIAQAASCC